MLFNHTEIRMTPTRCKVHFDFLYLVVPMLSKALAPRRWPILSDLSVTRVASRRVFLSLSIHILVSVCMASQNHEASRIGVNYSPVLHQRSRSAGS